MANTVFNPHKYNNRVAIDGAPLQPGQVLVPFWLQDGYKLSAAEKKNCTTYHLGGFKFHIGFIPIEARQLIIDTLAENLQSFIDGGDLNRIV